MSLIVGFAACSHVLHGVVFSKPEVQYRIGAPDEAAWRRVDFSDNDLAWLHRTSGHIISTNATCHDHGDAPLEVLTQHLLFGFTDREQREQETQTIDGREALHSKYVARLDGVPVEIELVVLKKNGCVHDFSYIAPVGQSAEQQAVFDRFVGEFQQERSP